MKEVLPSQFDFCCRDQRTKLVMGTINDGFILCRSSFSSQSCVVLFGDLQYLHFTSVIRSWERSQRSKLCWGHLVFTAHCTFSWCFDFLPKEPWSDWFPSKYGTSSIIAKTARIEIWAQIWCRELEAIRSKCIFKACPCSGWLSQSSLPTIQLWDPSMPWPRVISVNLTEPRISYDWCFFMSKRII